MMRLNYANLFLTKVDCYGVVLALSERYQPHVFIRHCHIGTIYKSELHVLLEDIWVVSDDNSGIIMLISF